MAPKKANQSERPQLQTKSSDVRAHAGEKLISNFMVWSHLAPSVNQNPDSVFGKLLVLPGSTPQRFKVRQVWPKGFENEEFEVNSSDCLNTNEDGLTEQFPDIGLLTHQNAAAVLHFLQMRWASGQIYTTADPLLVAINPFKELGVTGDDHIRKYRDAPSIDSLPPHIFSIARRAFDNYHGIDKSQTIIVTGESGAGKTEATKHVMRFFASSKSGAGDTRIQEAAMAANPVLEAFGNAKTIRNNNSSRFGRFMQLEIGAHGGIKSGAVQAFLLEKVRVVSQESNERSYHIFYQLLKGASSDMKSKYSLLGVNDYAHLKGGGVPDVAGVNDAEDWNDVMKAFHSINLNDDQIGQIISILSCVLLFGNVEFEGKNVDGQDDAATLGTKAKATLATACNLVGLPADKIEIELTTTFSKIGNEDVHKRLTVHDATVQRLSLAKVLYDRVFHWIIKQLNKLIEPPQGLPKFMGMLDIFGFEVFERNSLEQLLINITNEFLQKNFVDIVFEKEQRLYRKEGVSTKELIFTSNADVIDVLIGKKSIFSSLEDACMAPGGSDEGFVGTCVKALSGSKTFKPAKKAVKTNFIISHSVADIEYCSTGFLAKNRDLLKADLTHLIQASSKSVTAELLEGVVVERGKLAKGQLIASQFLKQLQSLMDLILSTEPHFVRCIKPNETKQPNDWSASKVLNQLFSLSILEALQLKQLGFSYRRLFEEFCKQFRYLSIADVDSDMDRRQCAEQILKNSGVPASDFQIGKTRIFMKPDAAKLLMLKQRQALSAWEETVHVIEAAMLRLKYKTQYELYLPRLLRIQANARWFMQEGVKGAKRPLPSHKAGESH